jgi:hypothetical protein
MSLDGAFRDGEVLGDLLVGGSDRDNRRDLALTLGQSAEPGRPLALWCELCTTAGCAHNRALDRSASQVGASATRITTRGSAAPYGGRKRGGGRFYASAVVSERAPIENATVIAR